MDIEEYKWIKLHKEIASCVKDHREHAENIAQMCYNLADKCMKIYMRDNKIVEIDKIKEWKSMVDKRKTV